MWEFNDGTGHFLAQPHIPQICLMLINPLSSSLIVLFLNCSEFIFLIIIIITIIIIVVVIIIIIELDD